MVSTFELNTVFGVHVCDGGGCPRCSAKVMLGHEWISVAW